MPRVLNDKIEKLIQMMSFPSNFFNDDVVDDDERVKSCGDRSDCWLNDKIQYKKSQVSF